MVDVPSGMTPEQLISIMQRVEAMREYRRSLRRDVVTYFPSEVEEPDIEGVEDLPSALRALRRYEKIKDYAQKGCRLSKNSYTYKLLYYLSRTGTTKGVVGALRTGGSGVASGLSKLLRGELIISRGNGEYTLTENGWDILDELEEEDG